MLMIGVTPLPALTKSSRCGGESERTKSPSTSLSVTIVPGPASLARNGETVPSATVLTVMLRLPSSRSGSEVSEYARQWRTPSMSKPIRTNWPARWPGHSWPGVIVTVTASAVSR